MLRSLHLHHFGPIEQLEITFKNGLSAITGETGAGKSLLLDALGLCFGAKTEAHLIRPPAKMTEIRAHFLLDQNDPAHDFLKNHGYPIEEEIILYRKITEDSQSRYTVNDKPASLHFGKRLGSYLVQIQNQGLQTQLLKTAYQLKILDQFGRHCTLLETVSALYDQYENYREEEKALETLNSSPQQEQFLAFQLNELKELALMPGEFEDLLKEHKQLNHAQSLIEESQAAYAILDADQGILSQITHIKNRLIHASKWDDKLLNIIQLIEDGSLQLHEAKSELMHYSEHLSLDDKRLQIVEKRLDLIQSIARKHQTKPEALLSVQTQLEKEKNAIGQQAEHLISVRAQIAQIQKAYELAAKDLHFAREKTAKALSSHLLERIKPLGLENARIEIPMHFLPQEPKRLGLDHIEILFSANPGLSPQILSKVVSGGELSRITLALQIIEAERSGIPILIFDEIDVGIGGSQAAIVGHDLKILGEKTQVICITHQPQVAAAAHQHYHVQKIIEKNETRSIIKILSEKERQEEIARMLSGRAVTKETRALAKQLLEEITK